MIKKVPILFAFFVALAIPSAASAEPIVKNALGEAATELHAVSENTTLITTIGNLQCTTVSFDITLTENSTETASGHGTGAAVGAPSKSTHSGPCEAFPGVPTDFTSVTVSAVDLKDDGTGTLAFSTNYDITHPILGAIPCAFSGEGTIAYEAESDEISFEANLTGSEGGPPCHTSAALAGDFTVTDEFGEPAEIG